MPVPTSTHVPVRRIAGSLGLALALAAGTSACTSPGGPASPDPTMSEDVSTPIDTDPAPAGFTDAEAARIFFDAVVAGDRDAAVAVAYEPAIEFFEPWEPAEGLTFSEPQDGVFFISPGAAPFQCRVQDGIVLDCADEPTGDQ